MAQATADQAHFHQLKLVCSKFRDIFAEHPELSNRVILRKSTGQPIIRSILLWIQRWRSSICQFICFSGEEHQEMLIGALACPDSVLNFIHLINASQKSVHALPVFSSLSRCDFHAQQGQLDLTALQALPSLKELHLSGGRFSEVSACLTYLCVASANVQFSGAPEQDIRIEKLEATSRQLSGLHDSGLAACTALSCLQISLSEFSAAVEDDALHLSEYGLTALIPARISELTCLTKLDMGILPGSLMWFSLDWVYSLIALRHLELEVEGGFDVSEDCTLLKELTFLKLSSTADSTKERHCAVYTNDWEPMQALRYLEFEGPVSVDTRILQLTSLTGLGCLHLTCLRGCTEDDTLAMLARLCYQLAVRCPQVWVFVDEDGIDSDL